MVARFLGCQVGKINVNRFKSKSAARFQKTDVSKHKEILLTMSLRCDQNRPVL